MPAAGGDVTQALSMSALQSAPLHMHMYVAELCCCLQLRVYANLGSTRLHPRPQPREGSTLALGVPLVLQGCTRKLCSTQLHLLAPMRRPLSEEAILERSTCCCLARTLGVHAAARFSVCYRGALPRSSL